MRFCSRDPQHLGARGKALAAQCRSLKEMGYCEEAINVKVLKWCRHGERMAWTLQSPVWTFARQHSLTDLQSDDRFYLELDRRNKVQSAVGALTVAACERLACVLGA